MPISNPPPSGNLVLLERVIADGSHNSLASSVTLTGYEYLIVVWNVGKEGGSGRAVTMTLNGDTGANYGFFWINSTTPTSTQTTTGIQVANNLTYNGMAAGQALIPTRTRRGSGGSTNNFIVSMNGVLSDNGVFFGGQKTTTNTTDRVTSITLTCTTDNFSTGSEMTIYGLSV